MKPSHRKDVIIARIIFAFICLALIAIIVGIVVLVSSHHKSTAKEETQQTESQKKDDVDVPVVSDMGIDDNDSQTPDTEINDTESTESDDDNSGDVNNQGDERYVEVIEGVRLRTEPSTEGENIIAVCPPGTILRVFSEENGWLKVDYEGQVGYVSSDFVQDASVQQ